MKISNSNLSTDRLIRLPLEDTKATYLIGFWRWVELLAANDYQGAIDALYWREPSSWTPEVLKERITRFWGGDAPWTVVVPNDRLIGVINDDAKFELGWFMAQVPVTTEPANPKNDEIPLMGIASSFFVRQQGNSNVMEHKIFHV